MRMAFFSVPRKHIPVLRIYYGWKFGAAVLDNFPNSIYVSFLDFRFFRYVCNPFRYDLQSLDFFFRVFCDFATIR
jgi:hypothetical protein